MFHQNVKWLFLLTFQKLEENLMAGLAEMGNQTIYALRQEAQIIGRRTTTALLENESEGNFSMQADGSIISNSSSRRSPGGNPLPSLKKAVLGRVSHSEDGTAAAGESTKALSSPQSLMPCLSRKGLLINGKMGHS
jgi:hypothetical protein